MNMKMIKTMIGLTIAALTMTACSSNSFKVEGVAEGFDDGDTLLVMSESPVPLDTIFVKDGKFEWAGEVDSVFVCSVVSPKNMASAMFFREPGTIHLLLSADGNSEVSGTKANDALQELNNVQKQLQKKAESLIPQLYADSIDENQQKELYAQYEALQKEMGESFATIAKNNIDNELGYFLLTQLAYSDVFTRADLTETIGRMPAEYQQRQAVREIQKMLDTSFSTDEGDQIMDFTMQSPEGNEVSIMDLVKENKITVLDFWASWCQPCREEMPKMKQLLADNKDKGFGIVGISLDDDKEAWIGCIEELELPWPHISDLEGGMSTVARSFGVQAIPFTAVIDQNGKVLKKGLRGEALAQFVSEQLK